MPILDMPLEKLREYGGINPKPEDFEPFWDKALDEMRSVDPQLELVRSDFEAPIADCFDLYFTGVRNARVHAKYLRPKSGKKPHPAVLRFHGYTGSSGDWVDNLSYVGVGFSVFALDCRGQGGKSEDPGGIRGNTFHGHIVRGLDDSPENMLFRHIYLDTAQLASIAMSMEEVDKTRVGATGWSQGGGLTLACAALEPRIKKLAPVYPFLCDYKRVWEMDLALRAYQELKDYFRMFDPFHEREEEVFTRLGYLDVQHLAGRIKGEVLLSVGLLDDVCPPSTQFAVYNKIRSKKNLLILPDFGHEGLPRISDKIFQFLSRL